MREDEDFDKIIQQKFAEKEFVFNEENWEKAERKINSSRRVNKFFRWTTIFSIGLCSGVAVMMPFVIHNGKKIVNENAQITSESKPGPEIAELINKENVTGASQEGLGSESREKQFAVSSKAPAGTDKSDQSVTHVGADSKEPEYTSQDPAIHSSIRSENVISNKGSIKDIGSSEEKLQQEVSPELVQMSSEKNSTGKVITQVIPDAALSENEKSNSSKSESKESIAEAQASVQQTEPGKDPALEKTATTADSDKQLLAETPPKDSAETKPDLQVNLPVHADTSVSMPVSQNISVQTQAPMRGLSSANVISLDAGVNCISGWSYHDTVEARGFNPLFGIGFTHYFNSEWALNSGIQYGSIVNFNATKKEFSSTKYDFGYSLIDTVVNTRSLYYAVLPLQLQYSFNNRNSVAIGGTVSYLVNAKSSMTVYSRNSFGISGISTNKQFGFMSGFRQWDASVSVAYRRKITEKLTVAALANYGLFDIKSDAFFLKQKFERNMGLKLVITYDLFQY